MSKVLITSALPYVNNIPHLGTIIGCVLPADVLSRYYKQQNYDVMYICGADENGTTTEIKALQENMSCYDLCSKYLELHKEIYKWFNIDFTYFGRTSNKNHEQISQDIFQKLYDNGYITCKEVDNYFCVEINKYVADRYIVGTCPNCSKMSRGDQCSNCNQVFDDDTQLNHPEYLLNKNYTLTKKRTKHLYLNLPALKDKIVDHINSQENADIVLEGTNLWLNSLKERCITRDNKFGVPLPNSIATELGLEDKIMYNWFDAPIGYISITSDYTDDWKDWWQSDRVKLVQVLGLDNIPFHTIMFLGTLLGTNDNYTLYNQIVSSYFLNCDGLKFSKTDNTGVFCDTVINISKKLDINEDYWRYYLIKNRPETKDTSFTWLSFVNDCNSDLVNNFGNLVNRTFQMVKNYRNCSLKYHNFTNYQDLDIVKETNSFILEYHYFLKSGKLRSALNVPVNISSLLNKFLVSRSPWLKYKQNNLDNGIDFTLFIIIERINTVCDLLYPFIPNSVTKIKNCINLSLENDVCSIVLNLDAYSLVFKTLDIKMF